MSLASLGKVNDFNDIILQNGCQLLGEITLDAQLAFIIGEKCRIFGDLTRRMMFSVRDCARAGKPTRRVRAGIDLFD